MKKVFKYGTEQEIPAGAVYLATVTNGLMPEGGVQMPVGYQYVWHYFLVEVI